MQETADHGCVSCHFNVGIIQHHQWRVTTEFKSNAFDVLATRGDAPDIAPTSVEPVNEISLGTRFSTKASPISDPAPTTTLMVPAGEARRLQQVGDQQSAADSGITRRFQHYGIT